MSKIQVELQETMGSDRRIAEAAWTSSYDHGQREKRSDEDVAKVIKMLATNGHGTPFESVVFRFWIRMPIFADRQHMTHRIQSSSGLSGRYRTLPTDWFSLPDDVLAIMVKMGQNPVMETRTFNALMQCQYDYYENLCTHAKTSEKAGRITNTEYKRVREIARGIIGTASMVERVSIMNLRAFANYQRLRNDSHAQAEIREVAQLMLGAVEANCVCPVAIAALKEIGWCV